MIPVEEDNNLPRIIPEYTVGLIPKNLSMKIYENPYYSL
jgi:hypothetical protein